MRRVQHATAKIDGNGAGKNGFSEGDVGTQAPATRIAAEWLNDVQEEIVNAIETAGLTPSASRTQLADAIAIAATGSSSANAVSIRGTNIASSPAPATSDVFQFNGTNYLPGKVTNANIAAAAAIAVSKLAAGVAGQVLGIVGGAAAWVSDTATSIRGTFVSTTAPTTGDVLAHNGSQYAPAKLSNANIAAAAAIALSKLAGGSAGQLLGMLSGVPTWSSPAAFVSALPSVSNNLVVAGIESALFVAMQSTSGAYTVTGLAHAASTPPVDIKIILNTNTVGGLTLKYQSTDSAAANRFTGTGSDVVVPANAYAILFSYLGNPWYIYQAV